MKRAISLILSLVLLVGMVPVAASAEKPQTEVQNDSITIQGTNSLGTLLSEDIQQAQVRDAEAAEEYEGGYGITGLKIEGNTATATYGSLEGATLVVSLYTEDGLRLLNSAKTEVTPDGTEASVTFEGTMPQYFYASAFLLDIYDLSPLCPSYDTPMYTREMQELLASTVEDYDEDKILNLDEDKTTNFAVFGGETIVIEEKTGVNTVASVNDETATYVIENADEQITELQEGDIFAYPYGENELLIVKVASININGTTATITGAEVETEEVFSYVKISENDSSDKMLYEEGSAGEGVTYLGLEDKSAGEEPATYSLRRDAEQTLEAKYTHKFAFAKSVDQKDNGIDKFTLTIEGTLDFSATVKLSYYVSPSRQFIEFRTDAALKAALKVNAKLTSTAFELGSLGFMIVPGVYVGFNPQIVFEINAAVETSISVSTTVGFSYENEIGFQNLCTAPVTKYTTKIEGAMMIGFDLCPKIGILCDMVQAGLEAMIGLTVTGKMTGTDYEHIDTSKKTASSRHICAKCLDGDVKAKLKVGVWAEFLKWEKLRVSATFLEKEWNLFDFYYSLDHNELAVGECPYYEYRLTLVVNDAMGFPAEGAAIVTDTGEDWGTTNANGITVKYAPAGSYNIITTIGDKQIEDTITVTEGTKIIIAPDKKATVSSDLGVGLDTTEYFKYLASVTEEKITDYGNVTASGQCGDNCSWVLYESGLLRISGTGDMYDKPSAPWKTYIGKIKKVEIMQGVTSIGSYAFFDCYNLTKINIPDSVTRIGSVAFYGCSSLSSITIPCGVTQIGDRVFVGCKNLNEIIVDEDNTFYYTDEHGVLIREDLAIELAPKCLSGNYSITEGLSVIDAGAFDCCNNLYNITIPDGVISIDSEAFQNCRNLQRITIPDSVKNVGADVFSGCTNLQSVVLSDNLRFLNLRMFKDCTSLNNVEIPSSVTIIYENAFEGCTNLKNVMIPNSITTIKSAAFTKCDSLTHIEIPESVTFLGAHAFSSCSGLTSVVIPDTITAIEYYTFAYCDSLTNIDIPDSITSIGNHAFYHCDSLNNVVIPNNVTSIGDYAFQSCINLTNVVIGSNVTDIGSYAFTVCKNLTTLTFKGDAPTVKENAFFGIRANAYYPAGNPTWTADAMYDCGGEITWIPYTLDENGEMITGEVTAQTTAVNGMVSETTFVKETSNREYATEKEIISTEVANAVYGGEYETEVTGGYTIKKATFSGLVPGEQYVLLALASMEAEDPLDADNLLYIDQDVAAGNGTLVFTYVQRVDTDIAYVMACGASNKNLKNAQITFPEMVESEEIQVINPTIKYGDKTLTEGIDYVLLGTVDYTAAGTYTCRIRGIRQYTGLVECRYTVISSTIFGDINADSYVNDEDVILLLWHTLLPDLYPIEADGDINGDSYVNDEDVILLLWHTLLPDLYPI